MSLFENKKVAFVGAGNMAEAVLKGLLAQGMVSAEQVVASDIFEARLATIHDRYGVNVTTDNMVAVTDADVVVLCVKPQIYPKVAPTLQPAMQDGALVVSVMAGVTIETMVTSLQHAPVVRSMPNTPAMIGQGMVVWTKTEAVTDVQKAQAQAIFAALGSEAFVDEEKYLDMATAMSGSGPAYVFLFMEAWIDAGVKMGFSRTIAEQL
ncbi:MAG: pyrroline-5-carboxylate reductase family protein, partial [Candidatus Promineifilaceae bacterium]